MPDELTAFSAGAASVTARLAAEVAAGHMQFDAAQEHAARRLDSLRAELLRSSASIMSRLRAVLPWLPGEPARAAPRGVYLWGGVGRGKTLLMDRFFESLRDAAAAPAAERSHFYHFMRNVHAELAGIKQHDNPLALVAQRLAARTRVLCLDEFFVADIGDAMLLAGLLEGLFRRGVTLVTTSNLPPQDLYHDGLQRGRFLPAIDLLQRHLEVLHLGGAVDYRLRRLAQAPMYFDANLPGTAAVFAQRFAALAGDARPSVGSTQGPGVGANAPAGHSILIEGRRIRAVNQSTGTVWFEFHELCEGPRSQNDYIGLAHLYHTIFVSNVPLFGADDDDAARRFIMLVDELYDRGVKLVVSAAAPPAELYRGERLLFEFQRAASRLIEMQAQAYLAGQHRP